MYVSDYVTLHNTEVKCTVSTKLYANYFLDPLNNIEHTAVCVHLRYDDRFCSKLIHVFYKALRHSTSREHSYMASLLHLVY